MKKLLRFSVIVLLFMALPIFTQKVMSQPPPPPPLAIPIDGGLSILIFAGVAYGAKRLHAQAKKDS